MTAVRTALVAVLVASTVTPGSTPPELSVTTPLICPLACAHSAVGAARSAVTRSPSVIINRISASASTCVCRVNSAHTPLVNEAGRQGWRWQGALHYRPMTCRLGPLGTLALVVLTMTGTAGAQPLSVPSTDGRRTLTAAHTDTPLVVDGVLDEPVWRTAAPATGFVQSDPVEGQPASEATEVRMAYDADLPLHRGVVPRCRSRPASSSTRSARTSPAREQDTFEVLLDTFADRRNGFVFTTNAAGAEADTQMANEGRDVNPNWDAVWWVAARVGPEGWTAEFRIPFKTLRFEPGAAMTGASTSRGAFAARTRSATGRRCRAPSSIYRASSAGTLTGLPDLAQGRNIRVKPYVLGGAVRPLGDSDVSFATAAPGSTSRPGVGPSLTFDVTINPDFAQAEADEQQVNLTQFSLFFPEKREFFLENSGIFYFGDIPRNKRQTTPLPAAGRRPAAVLQPPHRPDRCRRTGAALRRRAPDRPRRRNSGWA